MTYPFARVGGAIPAAAGIGLRAGHYREVVVTAPKIGWLEVHSENYFGAGGAPLYYLDKVRVDYPLSLHGVGLSLGSADPLDQGHLTRLKALIERCQPGLVSEHLAWCSGGAAPERSPARAVHGGGTGLPSGVSSAYRSISAAASSSKTSRVISNTAVRRSPNGSSWPRLRGAPAAGSCSTSTIST